MEPKFEGSRNYSKFISNLIETAGMSSVYNNLTDILNELLHQKGILCERYRY